MKDKKRITPLLDKSTFEKPKTEEPKKTKNREKLTPLKPSRSLKEFSDTYYKQLISPMELELSADEKIVISVQRAGELGLPQVDIRVYDCEKRSYTKKGLGVPLEAFLPLLMLLTSAANQANAKGLFDEVGVLPAQLDDNTIQVICPVCKKSAPMMHTAVARDPEGHAVRVCLDCHKTIAAE